MAHRYMWTPIKTWDGKYTYIHIKFHASILVNCKLYTQMPSLYKYFQDSFSLEHLYTCIFLFPLFIIKNKTSLTRFS